MCSVGVKRLLVVFFKTNMKKLSFQLPILAICIGLSFPDYGRTNASNADSSGFILVKKAKGIELYERWLEIAVDHFVREVKVIYVINASIESAAELIKNEEKATQWNKAASMYKIISNTNNDWVSYIQYDLPWPMDNQDCVLQYTASSDEDKHIINFRSIDHEIFPTSKNVTRIEDITGRWIFRPTETGTVVEYSITTTPSPTLPRWVTDPLVRSNLIDTMDEFRNILEATRK